MTSRFAACPRATSAKNHNRTASEQNSKIENLARLEPSD